MESALLPVFTRTPVEFVRGRGSRLWTADGKEYVDFYGGHAVALLGHGHPALLSAIQEQAQRLLFQSNLFPLEVREEAARALREFAGGRLARVFFVNSGAEANENALRLAFRATGRRVVLRVQGSFHGRTAGAAAVTEGALGGWYGFPQPPFEVRTVPFGETKALDREVTDDVAAILLEPVQGVAGARDLPEEFLRESRRLARERGVLWIADEVQCGMGRTGSPFVSTALGLDPDLLTVAKGLAGGLPAGAVLMTDAVAATVKEGDLGTTFGGGPLVCSAIVAVVKTIREQRLLERVRLLSGRLRREALVGPVRSVQGKGFLLGLRTERPARDILAALRSRHILAGGSADPHVVRLLPPLVLQHEDVDLLIDALRGIP